MIAFIAGKITSFFIRKRIIAEAEKEIYEYSFEMTLASFINLLLILLLAVLMRNIAITFLYLLGFVPLRMLGGGYHAKNHFRCMLMLVVVYLIFIFFEMICPETWKTSTGIGFMLAASVPVWFLAPLEDKNHLLKERQKTRLRRKTIIWMIISNLLVLLFSLDTSSSALLLAFSVGYLTASLSMMVAGLKQRINVSNSYTE